MPQAGFDWGDAGIGAAGGLALAMLGLGAALVISRRRPSRTRRSTALPT
jgi:MYXO-CTERM domain-containing protein